MEVPRSKCSIFLESLKELQKGKEEEGRLSARLRYDCTTAEKRLRAYSVQTSDLILMILDATKKAEQRALLEAELEAVGIRLNREAPYVMFE